MKKLRKNPLDFPYNNDTMEQAVHMYISRQNLDQRLNGHSGLSVKRIHEGSGRTKGSKTLSKDDKALVGALAHLDTQENVEKALGVSQTTVSLAKRGIGPGGTNDKELQTKVDSIVEDKKKKASSLAIEKLIASLEVIDLDEKSLKTNKDVASIAKSMSSIVNVFNPTRGDSGNDGSPRVAIIINTPGQKNERDYDVVEV